jgi:hypothetical protein
MSKGLFSPITIAHSHPIQQINKFNFTEKYNFIKKNNSCRGKLYYCLLKLLFKCILFSAISVITTKVE